VKDYFEGAQGKLTLHFLPRYPPDLNPDKLVCSHAKRTGVPRSPLMHGKNTRNASTNNSTT
jgi:transposase